MNSKKIEVTNFLGGLAPAWYNSSYPSYGNRNMAGNMDSINLTDPACLTQGPGLVALSGGTIDTLINSILDFAVSNGKTFGVGGDTFYEITPVSAGTASTPALPHTIAGTSVSASDICLYEGKVYYSYQTAVSANVGRYNTLRAAEADFDDDWATVSGTAHLCASCPLPLVAGGNGTMYVGGANRISSFVGTTATWTDSDFILPADSEIQDLAWNQDRLFIAANRIRTQGFYLGQTHTVGDLVLNTCTTLRGPYNDAAYTKRKEIKVNVAGNYRVKFTISRSSGSGTVYGLIYKNGVSTGNGVTTTSSSGDSGSGDIVGCAVGDLLQLYVYTSDTGTNGYVFGASDGFRICAAETFAGEPASEITLD
jgi:hypothetical protein